MSIHRFFPLLAFLSLCLSLGGLSGCSCGDDDDDDDNHVDDNDDDDG